jgi:hypothetical protein
MKTTWKEVGDEATLLKIDAESSANTAGPSPDPTCANEPGIS